MGTATVSDKPKRQTPREPIDVNRVYTLPEFKRVSGLSDWALRKAFAKGLRATKIGRCKFLCGRDFLTYLDQLGSEQRDEVASPAEPD